MYYLEIIENGERLPIGSHRGYDTLEEAKKVAGEHVDDALSSNTVRVYKLVATARMAGDGGTSITEEKV
jgi:hypothetical protein